MAIITIDVPDNKLDFYKMIFAEFKDISLEDKSTKYNDIFSEKTISMLQDRIKSPIKESLTLEQVRKKIRAKYEAYGL